MSLETQSVLEGQTTEEALRLREIFHRGVLDYVDSLSRSHFIPSNYESGLRQRVSMIEGPFKDEDDAKQHAFDFNAIIAKYSNFYRQLKDMEANVLTDIRKLDKQNDDNPVPENNSAAALSTMNRLKLIDKYEAFLQVIRTQIDELDKLDSMSSI